MKHETYFLVAKMKTELQKQVEALKSKQLQIEPLQKGRPSLFVSAKEAAGIDLEDIYEVALSALQTLIQFDKRFEDFASSLLHHSSTLSNQQRLLKTREENEDLNGQIKSLLKLLTLYINTTQSHQIIEFLIRRYNINELNVEDMVQCFLPVHNEKVHLL